MASARRLSLSFERHNTPRGPYRQVHLNGLLLVESLDYEWQGPSILVFLHTAVSRQGTLMVGIAGMRPMRVLPQRDVQVGVPLHLDGTVGLVIERASGVLEEAAESRPPPTVYDYLLQE